MNEAKIQSECVDWFKNCYAKEPRVRKVFFSVYNNPKNKAHGAFLKTQGLTAGVSDCLFLHPIVIEPEGVRYNFVCIEFKDAKGKQSQAQKDFQNAIELSGGMYKIFNNVEDFIYFFRKQVTLWNI